MTFKEAGDYVIPFGKYEDHNLDQIAGTDEGLGYLDWLIGQPWVAEKWPGLHQALTAYLGDPSIKKELEKL